MVVKTAARPAGKPIGAGSKPAPSKSIIKADTSTGIVPSHMRGDAGMGTEHLGQDDLEIPRIKLIQSQSPELQSFDELRPGHFFHTSAEQIFMDEVLIVPVFMDRRYILWNPREAGGGILARADDGVHWNPPDREFSVKLDKKDGGKTVIWKTAKTVEASGLHNWGTLNPEDPDSAPAATLMYSIVVVFPDYPDLPPAVLTLQRSSIKVGRRFNAKLKTTRAPIFGLKFKLRAVTDQNAANQDFFNLEIIGDGFVMDEAAYDSYKGLHEGFAAKGFGIKDLESAQGEGEGKGDSDGAGSSDTVAKGRRI